MKIEVSPNATAADPAAERALKAVVPLLASDGALIENATPASQLPGLVPGTVIDRLAREHDVRVMLLRMSRPDSSGMTDLLIAFSQPSSDRLLVHFVQTITDASDDVTAQVAKRHTTLNVIAEVAALALPPTQRDEVVGDFWSTVSKAEQRSDSAVHRRVLMSLIGLRYVIAVPYFLAYRLMSAIAWLLKAV